MKAKNLAFTCRVVGPEGDVDYATLKTVVQQKGLEKEVELVGPKFGEEKYAEFKQADVFLLPSDYDTFGLVLLEAMQFGVPCISTPMGGIPDVIGHGNGLIIPQINAQELALAMERLLLDPKERSRISASAFDHFKTNFTSPVFEQRLKNILSGMPDTVNTRLVSRG